MNNLPKELLYLIYEFAHDTLPYLEEVNNFWEPYTEFNYLMDENDKYNDIFNKNQELKQSHPNSWWDQPDFKMYDLFTNIKHNKIIDKLNRYNSLPKYRYSIQSCVNDPRLKKHPFREYILTELQHEQILHDKEMVDRRNPELWGDY